VQPVEAAIDTLRNISHLTNGGLADFADVLPNGPKKPAFADVLELSFSPVIDKYEICQKHKS